LLLLIKIVTLPIVIGNIAIFVILFARYMENNLSDLELPKASASVIDRIKYLIKLSRRTQAQFAQLVGIDASNLSKMMSGRLPVTEGCLNKMVVNLGVSKDWLVSGSDVPFARSQHAVEVAKPTADIENSPKGAPIYDIDVTAGHMELSRMFTEEHIIGYFDLPQVNAANPIIHVTGDSMVPKISNGAFLSIRPVQIDSPILWGQIYVVLLEDYRMVKYVRRHPNPDMVILHSANPDYDDIEVRRSDILALYLVEVIFNYDIIA
jgi:phage repressor protein C with HTH and peptisase S24 domain